MPPEINPTGEAHVDGARDDALTCVKPTTTKTRRMSSLTATMKSSALPIRSAENAFRTVMATITPLRRACFASAWCASEKKLAPYDPNASAYSASITT